MIAGVEQAAAIRGDKGMFITITTPSKYHPTRAVGKNSPKVHFNHKWDEEAYTPKDGQRYLVKLFSKIRTAFKDAGLRVCRSTACALSNRTMMRRRTGI